MVDSRVGQGKDKKNLAYLMVTGSKEMLKKKKNGGSISKNICVNLKKLPMTKSGTI